MIVTKKCFPPRCKICFYQTSEMTNIHQVKYQSFFSFFGLLRCFQSWPEHLHHEISIIQISNRLDNGDKLLHNQNQYKQKQQQIVIVQFGHEEDM